jgi:hypothetical protein
MYWGTLAIIAFFFLEFFWPMMYSHESEVATPTPSPEAPAAFYGRAIVQAKILYFSGDAFISCNSSLPGVDFAGSLESVSGVSNVFAVSDTGFVLRVNATNETQAGESFAELASLVYSDCGEGSAVLRSAGLEIEASNLSFQSLESFNDSRVLYPKDILDAFRASGSRDVNGFVESALAPNETITVSVTVRMVGTQFADKPQIEQLRFTAPPAQ